MARLARLRPQIEALGARIVVVTLSKPEEAQAFCAEKAPGVACYSDAGATSYRAFGLSRATASQVLSSRVFVAGAKAAALGHSIGVPKDDPLQMPGTFIIGADGRVIYAYYSSHVGDYPDEAALLKAVRLRDEI